MHRLRRLKVTFELVCNNVPLIKSRYPMCFLYTLPNYGVPAKDVHHKLMYIFMCARLFDEPYHRGAAGYNLVPGGITYTYSTSAPTIQIYLRCWNMGTHIPDLVFQYATQYLRK